MSKPLNSAELPPLTPGTLYLVATPIGNLEDITYRAVRVLGGVDVILAEDTRRTGSLLRHYGMQKPLVSYFRFNEARREEEVLERLRRGERVALVTDAGTPGISDPGQRMVAAAVAAGLRVESVPGACAMVAALTASGLPTDEVHFIGFLPHKSGQRRRQWERLAAISGTLVLYESPYRVGRLLDELVAIMPERRVVVARELTKKFEEYLRGTPGELRSRTQDRTWKGEVTVVIEPRHEGKRWETEGERGQETLEAVEGRAGEGGWEGEESGSPGDVGESQGRGADGA
jgi:16S rRNA (cytidine1402-2'-O)-methyltransferase